MGSVPRSPPAVPLDRSSTSARSARASPANVRWFRGGLALKAHRLCVSLNSRLESHIKEEEEEEEEDDDDDEEEEEEEGE